VAVQTADCGGQSAFVQHVPPLEEQVPGFWMQSASPAQIVKPSAEQTPWRQSWFD
jgi:hypothetical protein